LNNNPDIKREEFVNTLINRQTLLTAASKHGHINIVQYLIEECGADIEKVSREMQSNHKSVLVLIDVFSIRNVASNSTAIKLKMHHHFGLRLLPVTLRL
jgi:hypothetical protein